MRERIDGVLWRLWWRMQLADAAEAERGQSTVEYAIVTAAIAVAALGAVAVLGDGLKNAFEAFIDKLPKKGG